MSDKTPNAGAREAESKWGEVTVERGTITIKLGLGYIHDLVMLLEEWEQEGFTVSASRLSLARELLKLLRPASAAIPR